MPFNKINQDLDPANASQDIFNRSSGLIVTNDVEFDKRNNNQILNDVEMEQDDLKQEAKDDSKVNLFVFQFSFIFQDRNLIMTIQIQIDNEFLNIIKNEIPTLKFARMPITKEDLMLGNAEINSEVKICFFYKWP